jgi:AbrB family looped-hinge helix DNA binding protein
MAKGTKKESRSGSAADGAACCAVESVVTVDGRGQMVLPKTTREKAGIRAGDKLAVVSWQWAGKTCCICLVKADDLAEMAKQLLGPVMGHILRKEVSRGGISRSER